MPGQVRLFAARRFGGAAAGGACGGPKKTKGVAQMLLQAGHMWGRREVAVPIDAVTKIGTLIIHLSLTKHQVKDLPSVEI